MEAAEQLDQMDDVSIEDILEAVHNTTYDSGLFAKEDIKVRVNPYVRFDMGGTKDDFIHVFSYILEGRTEEQKAALSRSVVELLTNMFPNVTFIAMNVDEFAKANYCNKQLLSSTLIN